MWKARKREKKEGGQGDREEVSRKRKREGEKGEDETVVVKRWCVNLVSGVWGGFGLLWEFLG